MRSMARLHLCWVRTTQGCSRGPTKKRKSSRSTAVRAGADPTPQAAVLVYAGLPYGFECCFSSSHRTHAGSVVFDRVETDHHIPFSVCNDTKSYTI